MQTFVQMFIYILHLKALAGRKNFYCVFLYFRVVLVYDK